MLLTLSPHSIFVLSYLNVSLHCPSCTTLGARRHRLRSRARHDRGVRIGQRWHQSRMVPGGLQRYGSGGRSGEPWRSPVFLQLRHLGIHLLNL